MSTATEYPGSIKTDTQREAIDQLRSILTPGMTVHTILRHTSRSGMQRRISAVVVRPDGSIYRLDHLIAKTELFRPYGNGPGLKVQGAGMDMGFHLVYKLGRLVLGDGDALRQEWL